MLRETETNNVFPYYVAHTVSLTVSCVSMDICFKHKTKLCIIMTQQLQGINENAP